MTGQLKWTCDQCHKTISAMQRGDHVRYRCENQGRMLEARLRAAQERTAPRTLPCECGCGAHVPQNPAGRAKRFVDLAHYEAERARQRALRAVKDESPDEPQDERLMREMAPIAARADAITVAANSVRMLTGDASFQLWAQCLGLLTTNATGGDV